MLKPNSVEKYHKIQYKPRNVFLVSSLKPSVPEAIGLRSHRSQKPSVSETIGPSRHLSMPHAFYACSATESKLLSVRRHTLKTLTTQKALCSSLPFDSCGCVSPYVSTWTLRAAPLSPPHFLAANSVLTQFILTPTVALWRPVSQKNSKEFRLFLVSVAHVIP